MILTSIRCLRCFKRASIYQTIQNVGSSNVAASQQMMNLSIYSPKLVSHNRARALACVLAKATGKPVTLQKEETTQDQTTTIEYRMLED
jgi:hypothetical protein